MVRGILAALLPAALSACVAQPTIAPPGPPPKIITAAMLAEYASACGFHADISSQMSLRILEVERMVMRDDERFLMLIGEAQRDLPRLKPSTPRECEFLNTSSYKMWQDANFYLQNGRFPM